MPVRPDAIIIADHALARRRAALRSLADFATATDRRLNGPRQVCCRINRAVFDSAEPARNAGPRLVCALCRADRAGGRDMTFSENGVRPRCGWQQNKKPAARRCSERRIHSRFAREYRDRRRRPPQAGCFSRRSLRQRSGPPAPVSPQWRGGTALWDAGEHQPLSLGQAAKACGRSKSALSRDIKAGKFSASRNPDGSLAITPAELFRAFPPASHNTTSNVPRDDSQPVGNGASTVEHMAPTADLMLLRERVAKAEGERDLLLDQVAALRARLDREAEERRKLIAILTGRGCRGVEGGSGSRYG